MAEGQDTESVLNFALPTVPPPPFAKVGQIDLKLVSTVDPEEWECYHQGEEVGFARLLDESFKVYYPNRYGREIYGAIVSYELDGYGRFHTQSARDRYLKRAAIAICAVVGDPFLEHFATGQRDR